MTLSKKQIKNLENNRIRGSYKGRLLDALTNKKKREVSLAICKEQAKKTLLDISSRDILMISIGLYWAEGHKTGRTLGLVNSDPDIIKKWMGSLLKMGISREDFSPRLFLNTIWIHKEKEIISWWAKKLNLRAVVFSKTVKVKSIQKKTFKEDTYRGVLHIRVKKSSKLLDTWLSMIEIIKNS